ncbi:MAG: hypothetical protein WBE17_18245 [Anaerolineae bacterium]
MPRKFDWTFIGLGVGLVFLLGLGLISLYAYFSLDTTPANAPDLTWEEPWRAVDGAFVPPDLGLLPLAGDAVDDAVRRALAANELDAGYALVVQSPELTDAQRAGHLLLLSRSFMTSQQPAKSALCLRLTQEVIALSPALPDIARAETALQVAEGWRKLQQPGLARVSLDLAETLAISSTYLLDPQRVDILTRLAAAYIKMEDQPQAQALRQLASKLPPRSAPPQRPPDLALDRWRAPLAISETLTATIEARRATVDGLINGLLAGRQLTDADVIRLEPQLVAEDEQRTAFYRQIASDAAQTPETQAAAQLALTNWLTFKWRVARLDLQVSLAPAWEAQRDEIEAQLVEANANLFALYRDLASALPDSDTVSRARLEVLRAEILRGRLGLYPDYPLDELVARLNEAQAGLEPGLGPHVALRKVDEHLIFTLATR